MNPIQPVIRRDIYDLFKDGLDWEEWFDDNNTINYYGRLEEIEFLGRLYNLEQLPSNDNRYENAYEDIRKHTIENNDYTRCWVFKDPRFGLEKGNDELYLKFLCEIFHPEVRDEKKPWKKFLDRVNELLNENGYIIYPVGKTANRDIYGWKPYNPEESVQFVPFSQRYAEDLKNKKIKLTLPRKLRNLIYRILVEFDRKMYFTNDSGYDYAQDLSAFIFDEISKFYQPRSFVGRYSYEETSNMEDFICNNYPEYVFDYIEFFAINSEGVKFESRINQVLEINQIESQIPGTFITRSPHPHRHRRSRPR